ncbi:MAG: YicC/YloC family endoribonuclease [Lentisphaerota bacterium]
MSLCSMTGYGRGAAVENGLRIEVELSSVNRKQLDVCVSLPKSLSLFESRVFDLVHHQVSRGRVTGEVILSRSSRNKARGIRVDHELAKAYLHALRDGASKLGLKDDFSGHLLLDLPDVLVYEERIADLEALWPLLEKALKQAVDQLIQMRRKEGSNLKKELESQLKQLAAYLTVIRRHAPAVAKLFRKNLLARLEQAGLTGTKVPDERLLKEIALFADRSDISEEMTRLDSHLGQASELLKKSESVGRTLDFLVQEMLREINTIGSKANDGLIARQVVLFKAELERIREQVQNLE